MSDHDLSDNFDAQDYFAGKNHAARLGATKPKVGGGLKKETHDAPPPDEWEDFSFTSQKQVPIMDWLGERPCCSFPAREKLLSIDVRRIGFDGHSVEYWEVSAVGNNTYLKIRIGGMDRYVLELWGRNLERLKHYLRNHRISWLRQAKEDCYEDYQLYIGNIKFEEVTEKSKTRERLES